MCGGELEAVNKKAFIGHPAMDEDLVVPR